MNRETLTRMLQARTDIPRIICDRLVNDIISSTIEIVANKEDLKITNFGTFSMHHKKSRPGINWVSKEVISISERDVIKFTPSRNLRAEIQLLAHDDNDNSRDISFYSMDAITSLLQSLRQTKNDLLSALGRKDVA